ncbi:MAG TPA: hypothetical protein VD886_04280 [Herpetosiphonaceae bacterium]|nr:hypothetical protein [Herpetosiphonaceae bacterium]
MTFLLVPIDVVGLDLPQGQNGLKPMADFSQLPFMAITDDGSHEERFAENPFLGTSVLSEPLSDIGAWLPGGVHLHWTLPAALATARSSADALGRFPPAPNRWLVCGWLGTVLRGSWVIESDYVWDPGESQDLMDRYRDSLSIWPQSIIQQEDGGSRFEPTGDTPPYRYIGRCRALKQPWPQAQPPSYLDGLTALGYGEPHFAAFYPNCRSVFGFHDPAPVRSGHTWYEVFGWYANPDDDPLAGAVAAASASVHAQNSADDPQPSLADQLRKTLAETFRWTLPDDADWTLLADPTSILCYGRAYQPGFVPVATPSLTGLQLAVGNSATEAAAALMAATLALEHYPGDSASQTAERIRIEDYLGALASSDGVRSQMVDIGTTLQGARHQQGFRAHASGPVWVIRPRPPLTGAAPDRPMVPGLDPAAESIAPPEALADTLNRLNSAQERYDRFRRWCEELRAQVYLDWYRYIHNIYPPPSEARNYDTLRSTLVMDHDPDLLIAYLKQVSLGDLNQALATTGEIVELRAGDLRAARYEIAGAPGNPAEPDVAAATTRVELRFSMGGWQTLAGRPWSDPDGERSLAQQVVECFAIVQQALDDHNYGKADKDCWDLASVPGPRFWEPAEPVVLLAGRDLPSAENPASGQTYGPRGLLVCAHFAPAAEFAAALKGLADSAGDQCLHDLLIGDLRQQLNQLANRLALSAPTQGSPRPFMLEWQAAVLPVFPNGNLRFQNGEYDPDFIRGNWQLNEVGLDLSSPNSPTTIAQYARPAPGNADTVRGRSVLSTHATSVLWLRLENYIIQRLQQAVIDPATLTAARPAPSDSPAATAPLITYFQAYPPHPQRDLDLMPNGLLDKAAYLRRYQRQITRWAQAFRAGQEVAVAKQALEDMQRVSVPPALGERVYGVLETRKRPEKKIGVANGLLRMVNTLGRQNELRAPGKSVTYADQAGGETTERTTTVPGQLISPDALTLFRDTIGLAPDTAVRLLNVIAKTDALSLNDLDAYLGGAPDDQPGPNAGWFACLLRYADAAGYFNATRASNAQQVYTHSMVYGLPDGGDIARALLAVVNDVALDSDGLQRLVGLSQGAAAAILDVRDIAPISSLAQLQSITAVGIATFAKLFAYADAQNLLPIAPDPNAPAPSEEAMQEEYGRDQADPLVTALEVWSRLVVAPPMFAQALGGFNDALLMREVGWQLPIADPLNFDEYRAWSEHVIRPAVADQARLAPLPFNDFHPIRAGQLNLTALRLVDVFGQAQNIEMDTPIAAESLGTDGTRVTLPPRLAQPARLSLRWLAAHDDQEEWTPHPATTPICGWLVVDHVAGSLLIYDASGLALGEIDLQGQWRMTPGARTPVRPADLDNPHLRQMVRWICQQGQAAAASQTEDQAGFIESFGAILETALEHIAPHSAPTQDMHALLMSRPMALVRARVSLELRGGYAIQQSYTALAKELQGLGRQTNGYERVRFPLRIGEHQRYHDGVVGYWVEDAQGTYAQADERGFFAPQSAWASAPHGPDDSHVHIYRRQDGALNHWRSLEDPPMTVAVLLDPRGLLHATCGILPPKTLSLPANLYASALRRLQVAFLTAPILTARDQIQLPLPQVAGWSWSWIAQEHQRWTTLAARPRVSQQDFTREWKPDQGVQIWQALIDIQVLEPLPEQAPPQAGLPPQAYYKAENLAAALAPASAPMTAIKQRFAALPPATQALLEMAQADIKRLIDTTGRGITAPPSQAVFLEHELREGWLVLKPEPTSAVPPGADGV